jgi:hypothetical protein
MLLGYVCFWSVPKGVEVPTPEYLTSLHTHGIEELKPERWKRLKPTLSAAEFKRAITTTIKQKLNGIALKDRGAVYLLPPSNGITLYRFAKAVEQWGELTPLAIQYGDRNQDYLASFVMQELDRRAKMVEIMLNDCRSGQPRPSTVRRRLTDARELSRILPSYSWVKGVDALTERLKALAAGFVALLAKRYGVNPNPARKIRKAL